MSTYEALRDRALNQVGMLGQSEAQVMAQVALEECMKWVAFNVRIPSLIASATATASASLDPTLEAQAIPLGTDGFEIDAGVYQYPDRLYIKKDSTVVGYGTPYDYLEYHYFLDLKSITGGARVGLLDPYLKDDRPDFSYTITPGNAIWAFPIYKSAVLTFFYGISPAPYADGTGIPEILPLFDHILVNGAVLAVKEFIREPEQILDMWALFDANLITQVQRYDLFVSARRKRSHLTIHRSYRPR